ncbi:3-isopropylmalate dehydratase [Methanosarcinales archaeon]|nr:MAG: 3-isopropylmalate dehydratase [Methanosarcinales archaeon]
MIIKGKVLRVLPDDTNTDEIISGKYKYDVLDIGKLAVHTFEAIDPSFYRDAKKNPGSILVAGKNFGCGSSREQAPRVLQECDISCIVAESFARIFYRNSFNVGLPIVECKGISAHVDKEDELEIDLDGGKIRNLTKGYELSFKPIPDFMQNLLQAGGIMSYLRKSGGYE